MSLEQLEISVQSQEEAGELQKRVLMKLGITLPPPYESDPTYYDGNAWFAKFIWEALSEQGYTANMSLESLILLCSTNALSDYWLDEVGWENESRDYSVVLNTWHTVNDLLYAKLNNSPFNTESIKNDQIKNVVNLYTRAIDGTPESIRQTAIQHLILIHLYQGLTLFQENIFREHNGLSKISNNDLKMLKNMQIEKGGMMAMYFLAHFADKLNVQVPSLTTLDENYENFLTTGKIYPENGFIRLLVELGAIIQIIDDLEDAEFDLNRSVISPENLYKVTPIKERSEAIPLVVQERIHGLNNNLEYLEYAAIIELCGELFSQLAQYRSQRLLNRER